MESRRNPEEGNPKLIQKEYRESVEGIYKESKNNPEGIQNPEEIQREFTAYLKAIQRES